MSFNIPFTKETLDKYLKELAKEYRRTSGKNTPAEIVLIGGASLLINYGFRESTYDMDAIILAASPIKDAINTVGDKMGLPNGWLNADFVNTPSYTPRLIRYSKYYKIFSNILRIRTVSAEYLIAMKLMAGRQYKNDLSDVVGIIIEQNKQGKPLTLDDIKRASIELYDSYEALSEDSRQFIESVFNSSNLETLYEKCKDTELKNRNALLDFQNDYPDVLNEDNLADILKIARAKQSSKKI